MSPKRKADWGSLLAGLLFVSLGAAFILRGTGHLGFDVLWLLPVLAIGLGLTGITRALLRAREQQE